MTFSGPEPTPVDPFELPDDLGSGEVTWEADDGLGTGHLVRGSLSAQSSRISCDLMAVDEAYPVPVASETLRAVVHQVWRHGEVHLADIDGRLSLLLPGTGFDADRVLDAVGRLAKALGAVPHNYVVRLRLGA